MAAACWLHIPLSELVRDSEAIIVGRLQDARIIRTKDGPGGGSTRFHRATIQLEQSLSSRQPVRNRVVIEWESSSGDPNTDHSTLAGRRVLWLLERDPQPSVEWVYRADYPRRTIRLDEPQEVEGAREELARVALPGPRVMAVRNLLDETAAQLRSAAAPRRRR